MKYLFLMGGSGCGKTTLAMNLEKFNPEKYKRTLEVATRAKRDNEVQGWDYDFISESKFWELVDNESFFEVVAHQFGANKYGAEKRHLDPDKWNVVVACIEGFLSATRNIHTPAPGLGDKAVLVNIINDCELDVERSGRDPKAEENVNASVIKNILFSDNIINVNNAFVQYYEIKLSKLKNIRASAEETLGEFDKYCK